MFDRFRSNKVNRTPGGENSVNIQIGEPEENKLARSLMKYGGLGVAVGAGMAGGSALTSAMSEAAEQAKPVYARRLTEEQHAIDNARGSIERGESPEDYAMYEGIRQGLIGGLITPTDVNRMIIEGQLSPRAELLVSDIHDAGGPELHTNPREVAMLIQEDGGDAMGYLQRQQDLRDQLGIDIPV
jgi:hypothetical protein